MHPTIETVADALDAIRYPSDPKRRVSFVQVRADNHHDLLRGIGAAAAYVTPGAMVAAVDFGFMDASERNEVATVFLEHIEDPDGWTDGPDGTYAVRVTTAL